MSNRFKAFSGGVLLLMGFGAAHAEVLSVAAGGFEVRETVHVAAPPDKAYGALLTPARWWDAAHTFSHDATNLTLDARAGGCWCEKLADGGSVLHMTVLYAAPGKMLRLQGALGPLQAMAVQGVMTFNLKAAESGSDITVSYAIAGYSTSGFDGLSKVVDEVLGDQIARLKKLIDG